MLPWPAEKAKRSRLGHFGFLGLCRRKRVQSTYAIGAAPSGSPGWPLLAFWTASIDRVRIVLIASWSRVWEGITVFRLFAVLIKCRGLSSAKPDWGLASSHVPRWVYALVGFGAVAVAGELLGAPPVMVFAAACLGMVPLAGLIGHATGQVSMHVGPHWGGLLNATFGNAAELIITILALRQGLFTLVKASITGSIVGNTLLVLGLALLVGGVRHGLLKFSVRPASLNAALMILAVAGLVLPALFSTLVPDAARVEAMSLMVAVILLLSYLAYLLFMVRGRSDW